MKGSDQVALGFRSDAIVELVRLRAVDGAEWAEAEDGIFWVRFPGETSAAYAWCDAVERGRLDEKGRFFAENDQVALRDLSGLSWTLLAESPELRFEEKVFVPPVPGAEQRTPIRLIRSSAERPAELARVRIGELLDWSSRVVQRRFAGLVFAASEQGEVLVWGEALPAIPGPRYWLEDRVATLLGYRWAPQVPASALRAAAAVPQGSLLLLDAGGEHERVEEEFFLPVSREALRATLRHQPGGLDER